MGSRASTSCGSSARSSLLTVSSATAPQQLNDVEAAETLPLCVCLWKYCIIGGSKTDKQANGHQYGQRQNLFASYRIEKLIGIQLNEIAANLSTYRIIVTPHCAQSFRQVSHASDPFLANRSTVEPFAPSITHSSTVEQSPASCGAESAVLIYVLATGLPVWFTSRRIGAVADEVQRKDTWVKESSTWVKDNSNTDTTDEAVIANGNPTLAVQVGKHLGIGRH